jgi:hypothetical protein
MRKTKLVRITDEGRDKGKTFLLTEMAAPRTEKWAARALLAIANAGVDIPPEVLRMGVGAVIAAGFRALTSMAFADAEPLLDEMMQTVVVVPDPKRPDVVRALDDEDIEEVATILKLRGEVIDLHTGFSIAAYLSNLGQAARMTTPDTSDTQTSLKSSE